MADAPGGYSGGRVGSCATRAELEDTRSQIESEVRNAYLDLQAAQSGGRGQQNIDLMTETLGETRQRFEAGVSQSVDVVQSQESWPARASTT